MNNKYLLKIASAALLTISLNVSAQSTGDSSSQGRTPYLPFKVSSDLSKKGFFSLDAEWYGSLGFNKTYYQNSDINISQPGSNYTINSVQGHDEYKTPALRAPDNLRIGRFLDDEKKWGVELSLDHDKYTSTLGQTATVTGSIANDTGPSSTKLGVGPNNTLNSTTFSYMLHNGLNSLMVDLVYRKPLIGNVADSSSFSFIGKVGTGLAIVHPFNTIDGVDNSVGAKELSNVLGFNSGWWRIVGTSTGFEAGFRYVVKKPIYLELTNKQLFTQMSNIPVNQGHATQKLISNQYIISLGYEFGGR